jgi:hypothetical protein
MKAEERRRGSEMGVSKVLTTFEILTEWSVCTEEGNEKDLPDLGEGAVKDHSVLVG